MASQPDPKKAAAAAEAQRAKSQDHVEHDALDEALEASMRFAGLLMNASVDGEAREFLTQIDGGYHDVTSDVQSFGEQYALSTHYDLPMLASGERSGPPLPVNMHSALFVLGTPRGIADVEQTLLKLGNDQWAPDVGDVRLVEADDARAGFVQRLGAFILRRQFGAANLESDAPPGHLTFTVHTSQPGMRIHYHPAYWRDNRSIFGQPSSPVTGFVLPGLYTFGCVGPGQPLAFEDVDHEIPYETECELLW